MSRVVVAWGRFNPPTIGHKKLIEAVAKIAKGMTISSTLLILIRNQKTHYHLIRRWSI